MAKTPNDVFDIEQFITQSQKVCQKIENREIHKAIITRGNKTLFFIADYKKYKRLLNEYTRLKTLFRSQETEIEERELNSAEEMLLRIKDLLPFFADLEEVEVLEVVKEVKFIRLDKMKIVFEQESDCKEIYFILKGAVNIEIGQLETINDYERWTNHFRLSTLKPKALFGEMSALTGERRTARAITATPDTVLLSFKLVDEITEYNVTSMTLLYNNLLKILANRLKNMNKMIIESKTTPNKITK